MTCVSPPGLTGHTEVVRVVFSPNDIGLEELLKLFWEGHDPTQGSNTHTHTLTKTQKSPSSKTRPEGQRGVLEQKDDAQACAYVCVVAGEVSWV